MTNAIEGYTHIPEATFEEHVEQWFRLRYGEENVETQHYQSDPRWFVDVRVNTLYAVLYIELESRASEIRPGIGQALGYAAADPVAGVPMVITPAGHVYDRKIERLRQRSPALIREFDEERGVFLHPDDAPDA